MRGEQMPDPTGEQEEYRAATESREANVCDLHHFVWTWPIEGGSGSVGVCDLCGAVTTADRDAECYRLGKADGRADITGALAHVVRDHDMPPKKDSHGYDYRMGWWDAVIYADTIIRRGIRRCEDCPGELPPVSDLVERSSFGTPEAVAARASVSDETAAKVVARARELEAERRARAATYLTPRDVVDQIADRMSIPDPDGDPAPFIRPPSASPLTDRLREKGHGRG